MLEKYYLNSEWTFDAKIWFQVSNEVFSKPVKIFSKFLILIKVVIADKRTKLGTQISTYTLCIIRNRIIVPRRRHSSKYRPPTTHARVQKESTCIPFSLAWVKIPDLDKKTEELSQRPSGCAFVFDVSTFDGQDTI